MTGQERALYRAIESTETLHSGHTGNLKLETESRRVWIERAWEGYPADTWDENGPITGEALIDGSWQRVDPETWLGWIGEDA